MCGTFSRSGKARALRKDSPRKGNNAPFRLDAPKEKEAAPPILKFFFRASAASAGLFVRGRSGRDALPLGAGTPAAGAPDAGQIGHLSLLLNIKHKGKRRAREKAKNPPTGQSRPPWFSARIPILPLRFVLKGVSSNQDHDRRQACRQKTRKQVIKWQSQQQEPRWPSGCA
ncbi:hypothetical protein HMP0721_1387 [Pseudoramibacter alactolyticus ATCC 23263]|uniref:Uncharacterized protein n=1 Tax=Pseudoramibacter alactolyticus ATCC 23263 TaxID=887929 RepID=E6MHA2_9FIRM|nr:hypothetical protein HMP0721_1387 [Pseudoramibacter alactolyticus ATCC 23263]